MKILILILISSIAYAELDPKFIQFAKKQCDFENFNKPSGQRMACMEDYINCTTVGAGETDWNKLSKACLQDAKKRAEDVEWTTNSKRK